MNERQASGGIGFASALTLLFIGLKLGGVIAWPWLWVLAPLWIPFLTVMLILGVLLIAWGTYSMAEDHDRRRRGRPARHDHGPRTRWGRRG